MEKPSPNFVQNSLINPYKSKDYYPQKAKGISFFAFVFSIFLYISIFYIFNLSPSELFNKTKFWFFISNTLIIIILVDYGAFSSSKDKLQHDLYQEYIMMRRQPNAPLFSRQYNPQIIIKTCIPEEEVEEFKEKRIITHQSFPQEKTLTVIPESTSTRTRNNFDGNINEGDHDKKKFMEKKFQRSKSEIIKRVTIDESKNIIRRVETKKYESPPNLVDEENKNDEYANMSIEELNRRVEEFIQRFNRQIRLQRDVY